MTLSLISPKPAGDAFTPQLHCSRCGTITIDGLRYADRAAALKAATERIEEHIAYHEREDTIAQDPFYGLTD